jgi:hypothetical protein
MSHGASNVDGFLFWKMELWLGNLKQRDQLEDLGVNGRIVNFKEMGWEWVDQFHLGRHRNN